MRKRSVCRFCLFSENNDCLSSANWAETAGLECGVCRSGLSDDCVIVRYWWRDRVLFIFYSLRDALGQVYRPTFTTDLTSFRILAIRQKWLKIDFP